MPIKRPSKWFMTSALLSLVMLLSASCDDKPVLKIGDPAPTISENGIHGEHVSLSELKGKIVVIYFWTNSCCGDGVKLLEPFYRKYKPLGLKILAINSIDSKKNIESYARENALTFSILHDEHSRLLADYFAVGYPTVFILDGNGIVREKVMGHMPIEKLGKLVDKQLKIRKEVEANYEKMHIR